MAKKVAIIGAGASGLTAIKCCLEEGLKPTCFERTEDIGGLWRYQILKVILGNFLQENDVDGQVSIYRSLTMNSSKEMTSYSDLPIPEDYPNYIHHSKAMEYFRIYAKCFDLLRYIHFKAYVCHIRKCPDFHNTGQWEVVADMNGKVECAIFDAVLICTGRNRDPCFPLDSFPGIEKFKGEIMHSQAYKYPQKFCDKRIVVIGLGSSGADISLELSHVTKQVFLSTRTGSWVVNRVSDYGFPLDVVHFTRFKNLLHHLLPTVLVNLWGERKLNMRFNHENYGIKPQHRLFSKTPVMADDLPNAIITGRIIMKPNIKMFTEKGVIFEDGSREENMDAVIFATGYSYSFPFIEEGVIQTSGNCIPLYKFVFPPHLEKPTLAIIGLLQPLGAIMPLSELQARWATRVFKGLSKLPSQDVMKFDIAKKIKYNEKRYVPSQHISLQVQYVDHMDELASLSGVKPNLLNLCLTDPRLAWEVFFGPCSPMQFRLTGPGKWEGARNAILTQRERIVRATKTRDLQLSTGSSATSVLIKVLGCFALFAVILAYL